MKCPIDGEQLVMTDRAGIAIDYCPQCRGVWLDRGELDKIIERSATAPPAAQIYDATDRGHDSRENRPRKKKKRGGFIEDIFDS